MTIIHNQNCIFCGINFNINAIYLDGDSRNTCDYNRFWACERCRAEYLLKCAQNAYSVCRQIGLKTDIDGKWNYNNEMIRTEVESIQVLKVENQRLREEIVVMEEKLKQLQNLGYDRPVSLKYNEFLLDFDVKKSFHCMCGSRVDLRKRNGRYEGICNCGKLYETEIDRLIIRELVPDQKF